MITKIDRGASASVMSYLLGALPKIAPGLVNPGLKRDAKAVSQPTLAMTLAWEEPQFESPGQLRRVAKEFIKLLPGEKGQVQFGGVCFVHQESLENRGKGGGL
jgi:hypothetical protein